MKRKVAFISEHASPLALLGGVDSGGQNLYVDRVAHHLIKLGYEVDVYTRCDNSCHEQIVAYSPGIRVIHITAGPKEYIPKENLFSFMDEFAANMIVLAESQDFTYDLIHAHFWMSGYVAAHIRNTLKIPFVITFHALGKLRRVHQGIADGFPDARFKVEEMIVSQASAIIAECTQDKEDLMIHYFAEEEKVKIIPCGFDASEFYHLDKQEAKIKLGLDPEERIVLQLGRMVPRKGVDNVIKSMSFIGQQELPLRLLIVGGESDEPDPLKTPEIGRLQKIASQENISDKVTFVGRKNRDQLKYYYNAADVFVTTPWYEPFGITPLESMACGTPVIGSCVGGIKYSVIHGKTGFHVPPNDPEILGKRISEILTDDNTRMLFSKNAIDHVNKLFTWNIVTSQIAELYEGVNEIIKN